MGLFDKVSGAVATATNTANEFLTKNGFDDALNILLGNKSSKWQGLNPYLLAKFYPVKVNINEDGSKSYLQDFTAGSPVIAPLLDGAEMEYAFNWQSPFEQMGAEAKAPALTAMLQSGILAQAYSGFMHSTMGDQAVEGAEDKSVITQALKDVAGRTGITKLNSTQTFSGMPPIKCSMKLLFRAYSNARAEVNTPITQLLEWAVPQELSPDSTLILLAKEAGAGSSDYGKYANALLPSKAPTMIAMEYKGRVYSPMVIEAISDPITSPITSDGYYARAEVSLTISSLTAWDKADIKTIYSR